MTAASKVWKPVDEWVAWSAVSVVALKALLLVATTVYAKER